MVFQVQEETLLGYQKIQGTVLYERVFLEETVNASIYDPFIILSYLTCFWCEMDIRD